MIQRNVLAAVALAAGLTSMAATAQTWEMPTPYPESSFHTVNIKRFAEDVLFATDGAFEIVVYSNESRVRHPDIKVAVQSGRAPIGEVMLSTLGNDHPVFEIDSVPFLATDYPQAKTLWEASVLTSHGVMMAAPSPSLAADLKRIGETMTDEWASRAGPDGRAILDAHRRLEASRRP